MKYKTIALFCAITIAAFAVVNTGFAKDDPSPPGASQVISSDVLNEIPATFAASEIPVVTSVIGADFVIVSENFRGNPILLANESPKSRPPNQRSAKGFNYDFNTNTIYGGALSERLKPDH